MAAPDGDNEADLVIGGEDEDAGSAEDGADLVIADDSGDAAPGSGATSAVDLGDADGLLLALEDEASPRSAELFGELRRLSPPDIELLAQGTLSTRVVLGLAPDTDLARLDDDSVRRQVKKLKDRITQLEREAPVFQKARTGNLGYKGWLQSVEPLAVAQDAADRLRKILQSEAHAEGLRAMKVYVATSLDEKFLHWNDHQRNLRRAARYGLSEKDLEALYAEHGPFERESREEAVRSAPAGWEPHKDLPAADDWAGDLPSLQAAMLKNFAKAQEISNAAFDKAWSLYDYLDRNKADEPTKSAALEALKTALEMESPPVAPWAFLWSTGYRALHLGVKAHRPTKESMQVQDLPALLELLETKAVLPALGGALEAGLLETWLSTVAQAEGEVIRRLAKVRKSAAGKPASERPSFVRKALVQVLWQLGLRGLPAWDADGHGLVMTSVSDLRETATRHFASLHWHARAGTLTDWIRPLDASLAQAARTCEQAPETALEDPEDQAWADQLSTYRLLWRAGYRRLPLGSSADQRKGTAPGVDSPEQLAAALDSGAGATAMPWLDRALRVGYGEAWAADALGDAPLSQAAAAIRQDDRALKPLRFGQRVGMTAYVVAGVRVATPAEFAELPLKVEDLSECWEHIRERVPQERWANQPQVVLALDSVREQADLPDASRPMVACLRLGLRAMPIKPASKFLLQSVSDLGRALDARYGRGAVHRLLEGQVLEEWAERNLQGGREAVRGVRQQSWGELGPAVAPDAAAWALGVRAVHVVPGRSASDFASLQTLATQYLQETCGDAEARARIRAALAHRVLDGAPGEPRECTEEELQAFPEQHRAHVFSWRVLGLPHLPVANKVVTTCEALVAEISHERGRDAARALAACGVLSQWAIHAQGLSLDPALAGAVTDWFPALALELGERPPALLLEVPDVAHSVAEGESVELDCSVRNQDPLREAALVLTAQVKGPGLASAPGTIRLAPGASHPFQVTYTSEPGASGEAVVTAQVLAHHPGGPRPLGLEQSVNVATAFPWGRLVQTTLAWAVALPLLALGVRAFLAQVVTGRLYEGNFILPGIPEGAPAAAAFAFLLLFLVLERAWVALTKEAFWAHDKIDTFETLSSGKVGWIFAGGLGFFAGIAGALQGKTGGCSAFFLGAFVGWVCLKLAQRDVPAALAIYAWVVGGGWMGEHLLELVRGIDGAALVAGNALAETDWNIHERAAAGWVVGGALLGGGQGLAAGFRSIDRPGKGDAVQVLWLAAALLFTWRVLG